MKKKNFEDSLNKLEDITEKMEDKETSLEQAMELYKEGVLEAAFCKEYIENIEHEVKILKEKVDGNLELIDFEPEEED